MQENLPICFAVQLLPIHVIVWRPGVLHVIIILLLFYCSFLDNSYMIVHMHAASNYMCLLIPFKV